VRDVTIPPGLMPLVREHLLAHTAPGPDGLLFPSRHDPTQHLRESALTRVYDPARKAAGRPDLRFHDLPHTGAALAQQTGATLAELMGRLGHSTSQAALRYRHIAQDRDAVIAAQIVGNGRAAHGDVTTAANLSWWLTLAPTLEWTGPRRTPRDRRTGTSWRAGRRAWITPTSHAPEG